ncbi:macrophage mannose receptor 1-like [Hoplias malabaricus]|uniref:macrophage mannose receptor 1-like n=1 Tax=Hoplias malabaricus TaxID=27720 RepID=UPI0034636C41
MEAKLRVILDDRIEKLILPLGIPPTVEELQTAVKENFGTSDEFSLQYLGTEVKDYFTLYSGDQIKHKDTIKLQDEFHRITMVHLESKFMSKLDEYPGLIPFQGWDCWLEIAGHSTQAVCGVSAYTSYRYVFVNENKTWTEAQSYCRQNYTDLATVNNMEEMKNLNTTLKDKNTSSVWIGLKRGNTGRWHWSLADEGLYSEGEEYRNWDERQPDNQGGKEFCVTMWKNLGKWNDEQCNTLHHFVCYDEKNRTERYIYINDKKTWPDAQSYCREHYTDLVNVSNQMMNDEIWGLSKSSQNNDNFWIGLFYDSWQWSDQSNSSFRYWRSGPDYYDKLVLVNQTLSWKDALRYCREHHVDLVSVHSEEVQSWVMKVAQKASTDHVWLGLRHTCTLSFWFWVSGESICYQNWAPGNGTGTDNCGSGERSGVVESSGGQQWVSLPETQQLNFICTNY